MADFRPETTVYLFEATGVDAENQPFFESEGAKMAWYMGKRKHVFEQYSYQRENRQYIRVNGKAGDLRSCDMMAFQNSEWKWIICRILAVEFINPNTTEITFEIDAMQTFIENIIWCECWVEREMQSGDWDGGKPSWNNLQPEGLEAGKLTRQLQVTASTETEFTDFKLVLISAYDTLGEPNYTVNVNNDYPSGLNAIRFDIPENGTIPGLNNLLTVYEQKGIDVSKAIVGAFVCPSDYGIDKTTRKTISVSFPWDVIDGYKIVNAKCFSSEFVNLEISNRRGDSVELKPEMFTETTNPVLSLVGNFGWGSGGAILYPTGYEGNPKDFGVILYNDIQAPWSSNVFSSWLSANASTMVANLGADLIKMGANIGIGSIIPNPIGSTIGAVKGGAQALATAMTTMAAIDKHAKNPMAVGGQSAGSVLNLVTKNYGFSINLVWPMRANIKCIDEFFSRFGYRTNRLKKPNVNTRPLWNYVKTAGAVVKGPFDYVDKIAIQTSMDNGVTFWHVPNVVLGDYSNPMGNRE